MRIAVDLINPAVTSLTEKTESETVLVSIDGNAEMGFRFYQVFKTESMFGVARLRLANLKSDQIL